MHPLVRLRQLLATASPHRGTVVKSGASMTIATNTGSLVMFRAPGDANIYRVGDEVVLSNGTIVGKRSGSPTVYVV